MESRIEPLSSPVSGLIQLQKALIDLEEVTEAFRQWSGNPDLSPVDFVTGRGPADVKRAEMMEGLAELLQQQSELRLDSGHPGGSADRWGARADPSQERLRQGSWNEGDWRFQIVRHHAEGGLGTVSVAIDRELNREVALKQIHARQADDPARRGRFLIEAEITGGLEHPGIVPVYSLGHSADGRPYYAMRLIRGETLADAIARFHDQAAPLEPGTWGLELRKLLRRFIDVCNAIEYAHGRGIVHRDLKPSNVMLGKHGETLVVDWGLAKSIDADPTEGDDEGPLLPSSDGSETLPGSAVGTPSFMSPEQAAGQLGVIGTLSDVYSLGATLYCLLTGSVPFPSKDPSQILQDVRDGNFPVPCQINPRVPRPLEAICLKAMAQDPARRYGSPRELAEDIDRWQADQTTSAFREPLVMRVGRWTRRRRPAVAAVLASLLVAWVALGIVLAVQSKANSELREANDHARQINQALLEANRRVAKTNEDLRAASRRERSRFELALEAIRSFHGSVSDDLLLREAEFASLRSRLLGGAIAFYRKLEGQLVEQPDLSSREAIARVYTQIASLEATLGTGPEILVAHHKALALRKTLAQESPEDIKVRSEVASALISLGMIVRDYQSSGEGLRYLEEGRSILEELIKMSPEEPNLQGLLVQAEQEIGLILSTTGKRQAALAAYDRALRIQQKLVDKNPNSLALMDTLATLTNYQGVLLMFLKQPLEAFATLEKTQTILEQLIAADHGNARFQSKLADVLKDRGDLLTISGKFDEALRLHHRALTIRESLSAALPASVGYRLVIAHSLMSIGYLSEMTGQRMKALAAFRRSASLQESLSKNAIGHYNLAHTRSNLSHCLQGPESLIEADRAAQSFRLAIENGFRDFGAIKSMADSRPNLKASLPFRLLLLDISFPENPFGGPAS